MEGTDPSIEKCSTPLIEVSTPSLLVFFRALDLRQVEPILWDAYTGRRRRPPYPPAAMFKALLFQKMKQISSFRKLAKTLKHESIWLSALGFERAPCHDSFSEFTKRIGPERFHRVFQVFQSQLRCVYPDLGRRVAFDSTIVRGYSNPRKRKEDLSDLDARWGVTGQKLNKPNYVFGYKVHVACDADFEIPLEYRVVPANRSDCKLYYRTLLSVISAGNPVEVAIADAGYDSKTNILWSISRHVAPIIKINRRRSKHGTKRLADYLLPIRRDSPEWTRLYNMRTSAERIFSRLKTELGLEHLKLRRLERVEIHFAMSLITMAAIASTATITGLSHLALCIEPWRY